MLVTELQKIKTYFERKINLLSNNFNATFPVDTDSKSNPNLGGGTLFAFTLYCMSVLDFFSGAFTGYSEKKGRSDRNGQTTRMIKFLNKYLHYDEFVSRVAIDIFRHKLVHLAEPLSSRFRWEIASWQGVYRGASDHWTIQICNSAEDKFVRFGVGNFIKDLREGVLIENGYYNDLVKSPDLQNKYQNFLKEIQEDK